MLDCEYKQLMKVRCADSRLHLRVNVVVANTNFLNQNIIATFRPIILPLATVFILTLTIKYGSYGSNPEG